MNGLLEAAEKAASKRFESEVCDVSGVHLGLDRSGRGISVAMAVELDGGPGVAHVYLMSAQRARDIAVALVMLAGEVSTMREPTVAP